MARTKQTAFKSTGGLLKRQTQHTHNQIRDLASGNVVDPNKMMPGGSSLPFFAAEYEGRRLSIRRTADYDVRFIPLKITIAHGSVLTLPFILQDMINCVRRAFPNLSEVPASQVSVAQAFPELGEGLVEISREMWKDTLPLVKTTQVLVSKDASASSVSKKRKTQALETESGPAAPKSGPTAVESAVVPTASTAKVEWEESPEHTISLAAVLGGAVRP
ncbi:hypothetical protein FRC11_000602 [Ceratobasidium sp. 423]|nr:hypothetical protein FRC11_000602 [Ceratobasidium sp. 423]